MTHTLDVDLLGRYMRLIGKLIYLTVTRPDIIFVVDVLSRLMHEPREAHWLAALKNFGLYQGLSRERPGV